MNICPSATTVALSFPAENEAVWQGWCDFFSRTREPDRRRKGLVEVVL